MSGVQGIISAELSQFLDLYLAASRTRIRSLEQNRDKLEVKSGIYTDLKSKLSTLRGLAEDLSQGGSLSVFGAKTASSNAGTVLTATAGAGAVSTAHTIHIDQLARSHSVLSHRYTSTGTDLSESYEGAKRFTITVGGTDYDVTVTIDAGDTNEDILTAVTSAVNDVTDIPVRASKINDTDSSSKLHIAATSTGTENKMTFVDTDGLLAALGVTNGTQATDTVGGYVYADLGDNELDAKLTVDGVGVIKSSNTISDVLAGVTLELLAAQDAEDTDVTLTVSVDTETIESRVQEFLDAYNDAYSYLTTKISVDSTTYDRGALAGDLTYVNLWQNIRTTLAGSVSAVTGGTYSALSQIGITSSRTGSLSITDTDAFETALTGHLDAVEDLFNSEDGIAVMLEDLLDDYTSAAGMIWTSKDALGDRIDLVNDRIENLEEIQAIKEKELINQYNAFQEAAYLQQAVLAVLGNFGTWIQG